MARVRTRTLLFTAALMAPAPALFAAATSCSLQGLAEPTAASSSSGALESSSATSSSSSSGQGGAGPPLRYEAESASLYGKFVIGMDPDASGGEYVFVPTGAGCADGLSQVIFDVSVSASGKYVIWATVSADSGLHDSFFVAVDGADAAAFSVSPAGHFEEEALNDSFADVKAPIQYTWDAGSHKVVFKCREDGASLDRIRLQVAPP